MMAELTPALTIRVAGDYSHQGGHGGGTSYIGRYQAGPGGYTFIPSGLPLSEGLFTPAAQAFRQQIFIAPSGRLDAPVTGYPWRRNNFYGANAELTYDTGAGTLTFIPAWRYAHINQVSSSASFTTRQREKIEQYSAELRFTGNRLGMFDYILGGYAFRERIDSLFIVSASALLSAPEQHFTTTSFAPFARITANLSDRLRLVGGMRYTVDKKTFDHQFLQVVVACPAAPGMLPNCPGAPLVTPYVDSLNHLPFPLPAAGAPPIPIGGGAIAVRSDSSMNLRLKNTRVTWRAAAEYDVAPRSLLYASVETGCHVTTLPDMLRKIDFLRQHLDDEDHWGDWTLADLKRIAGEA